jgi:hypothetical protein
MTGRPAITLRERLDEARAQLWLCRLACDLTLARWAPTVGAEPAPPAQPAPASAGNGLAATPAQGDGGSAGAGDAWPTWQPIWLHERCRPHPIPLIRLR